MHGRSCSAGIAIHSLRAAAPQSVVRLVELAEGWHGSIHVHVAEQLREVDDCIAATGARPIEWLARERLLDERWQLVHATHATRDEMQSVAASGAGVVLCPSTEANLGDGVCDLSGWLASGTSLSIGSDSHVTRAWREELRLLEYGQRLMRHERNVAAAPEDGRASTAERLWSTVLDGSAAAAGLHRVGLQRGARADLLVVDGHDHAMLGVPPAQLLDALVFSSPGRPWRDVMVAGRFVVREHRHRARERDQRRVRSGDAAAVGGSGTRSLRLTSVGGNNTCPCRVFPSRQESLTAFSGVAAGVHSQGPCSCLNRRGSIASCCANRPLRNARAEAS